MLRCSIRSASDDYQVYAERIVFAMLKNMLVPAERHSMSRSSACPNRAWVSAGDPIKGQGNRHGFGVDE